MIFLGIELGLWEFGYFCGGLICLGGGKVGFFALRWFWVEFIDSMDRRQPISIFVGSLVNF